MGVKCTVPPGRTTAACGPVLRITSVSPGIESGRSGRSTANSTRAYMPGTSTPPVSSTATSVSSVRDAGSNEPAVRVTVPRNLRPGRSGTVSVAGCPARMDAANDCGTFR